MEHFIQNPIIIFVSNLIKYFWDAFFGSLLKFIGQTFKLYFRTKEVSWLDESKEFLESYKYLALACLYNLGILKFFFPNEREQVFALLGSALKNDACGGIDGLPKSLPALDKIYSNLDNYRTLSMTILMPIIIYVVFAAFLSVMQKSEYKKTGKSVSGYVIGGFFIVPGMLFNTFQWRTLEPLYINAIAVGAALLFAFFITKLLWNSLLGTGVRKSAFYLVTALLLLGFSSLPNLFRAKAMSDLEVAVRAKCQYK